jgi:hypothetical protein
VDAVVVLQIPCGVDGGCGYSTTLDVIGSLVRHAVAHGGPPQEVLTALDRGRRRASGLLVLKECQFQDLLADLGSLGIGLRAHGRVEPLPAEPLASGSTTLVGDLRRGDAGVIGVLKKFLGQQAGGYDLVRVVAEQMGFEAVHSVGAFAQQR